MTTETLDRNTGMPVPTPRRIDLSSLRDIRLELAHVYRQMDSGDIQAQDGTRRAFVLKTIADVLISAELERRILALEDRYEAQHSSRRPNTLQSPAVN